MHLFDKLKAFGRACVKPVALLALMLPGLHAYAQRMDYEVTSANTIFLKSIENTGTNSDLEVFVDGELVGKVYNGGLLTINRTCKKFVRVAYNYLGNTKVLWRAGDTAGEWHKKAAKANAVEQAAGEDVEPEPSAGRAAGNFVRTAKKAVSREAVTREQVAIAFEEALAKDSFYSASFVQALSAEVDRQLEMMEYVKERESRERYITEHNLRDYVKDVETLISRNEAGMELFVHDFLDENYGNAEILDRDACVQDMRSALSKEIKDRRYIISRLGDELEESPVSSIGVERLFSGASVAINILVGILVVCLVVLIVFVIKKRKGNGKPARMQADVARQNAKSDIIVRRKTTSILKKQSLEDVHHNNAYLQIDCSDFCSDSAVRRIYFKNTCIKDIYNMYAEDLRVPDNPNEDGCMVLGRWVHDEENDEYYVSLEEIVKPGDDAIFKEYELNFGGKIKLKVAERLRRLRRETNLQYDMTCWVHSHPGLGVFFSNPDSTVQMQLKHPSHPKFLVAIVVDILTPKQELGIFTFRHDLSINSKADLKKMYSLEELYKWAVESDRTSFKAEDYLNIMRTAKKRLDGHAGVELSNGAIIDICRLQAEHSPGLLAWVHGFVCENNGKREFIVKSVTESKHIPDNDLVGCFIMGAHCSIPTIRRVMANDMQDVEFILFYSTADDLLTSIPVIGNDVSVDECCYGEEKLEGLKIWTRRKR